MELNALDVAGMEYPVILNLALKDAYIETADGQIVTAVIFLHVMI